MVIVIARVRWSDGSALEAHLRTPHVARLIGALPDLVQWPPVIQAHEVSHSGPLPLPG